MIYVFCRKCSSHSSPSSSSTNQAPNSTEKRYRQFPRSNSITNDKWEKRHTKDEHKMKSKTVSVNLWKKSQSTTTLKKRWCRFYYFFFFFTSFRFFRLTLWSFGFYFFLWMRCCLWRICVKREHLFLATATQHIYQHKKMRSIG